MKVINLYGGPGTGKSTTAAEMFALMKHKGYNVELVREYAKELVWEGIPLNCQLSLLSEQYRRQNILKDKVDYIITDSPLLLSLYYSTETHVKELAKVLYAQFDNIDIFLRRVKMYNPRGRMQTESESIEIDKYLKSMQEYDFTTDGDTNAAQNILKALR